MRLCKGWVEAGEQSWQISHLWVWFIQVGEKSLIDFSAARSISNFHVAVFITISDGEFSSSLDRNYLCVTTASWQWRNLGLGFHFYCNRIIKPFRLEKTFKTLESNHNTKHNIARSTTLIKCPLIPHLPASKTGKEKGKRIWVLLITLLPHWSQWICSLSVQFYNS